MFCKWCGANLVASDTKCKRCGKEVPALSDCGGFYDLVPNANKPNEVCHEPEVPPVGPPNPSQTPEQQKESTPARCKKGGKKLLIGSIVLTAVGFLLVILLLVSTLSKVDKYESEVALYASEVSGLQTDIEAIAEKIDAALTASEPEKTEHPTVAPDPVLAEQNVAFTVTINAEDTSKPVDAGLFLGDYKDTTLITYCLNETTDGVDSVSYSLQDSGTEVILSIVRLNDHLSQSVYISYEIDADIFGQIAGTESCSWQYRYDANADWQELPEGGEFTPSGQTGLCFNEAALQELDIGGNGQLELRCEICRINTNGGSMTVVIEGIRFCEEGNN